MPPLFVYRNIYHSKSFYKTKTLVYFYKKIVIDKAMDIQATSAISSFGFAHFRWHHGLHYTGAVFFYGSSLYDHHCNYHCRV